jgi:hypothetical protein
MSRVPSTRAPQKLPSTPARTRVTAATTPSKARTQSAARSGTPTKAAPAATSHEAATTTLSIKEVIALRRAEAKKAQAKGNISGGNDFISLDDPAPSTTKQEEDDNLGRWPVRETIERARSTGDCRFAYSVLGSNE